nr:hypothetical protein [Tanacetum cinerariifolium]
MFSSSSHATSTYNYVSTDSDLPPQGFHSMEAYEPEAAPQSPKKAPLSPITSPEYLEYLAPSDDDIPAEDQLLPADASHAALLPGYIADSEPIEDDFEVDPVEYPSEEEEEPSALTNPASPVPNHTGLCRARKPVRPQPPPPASIEARNAEYVAAPTPPLTPPSPLSPISSPLLLIPSTPLNLPSLDRRGTIPKANMPPQKRAYFTTLSCRFEIRECSTADAAREPESTLARGIDYGFIDTLDSSIRTTDERVMTALKEAQVSTLRRERRYHRHTTMLAESEPMYARQTWSQAMYCNMAVHAELLSLSTEVKTLHAESYNALEMQSARIDQLTLVVVVSVVSCVSYLVWPTKYYGKMAPKKTPMCDAVIKALIAQGVVDALADYEANRGSENGHDSHDSGSRGRRHVPTTRVCTYKDFLNCQALTLRALKEL